MLMIDVMIIEGRLKRDTHVSKSIGSCTSLIDQISCLILELVSKEHATNIRIILQRDLSVTEDTLNSMRLLLRKAFLLTPMTKIRNRLRPNWQLLSNLNKRLMV